MTTVAFHRLRVRLPLVATALFVALALARPVGATEPLGDLDVQLRVVELTPDNAPASAKAAGVAKIQVLVQAFRETKDVEVRVLRPDGSARSVRGRPEWSGPGGEPLEPGVEGPSVRARGAIRATIVVPLEHAAVDEIVVAVTGRAGGQPIRTSGVVRASLGNPHTQAVDDGNYANFFLDEGK